MLSSNLWHFHGNLEHYNMLNASKVGVSERHTRHARGPHDPVLQYADEANSGKGQRASGIFVPLRALQTTSLCRIPPPHRLLQSPQGPAVQEGPIPHSWSPHCARCARAGPAAPCTISLGTILGEDYLLCYLAGAVVTRSQSKPC